MSAPNWLGLLKWSLAVGDGTSASEAKEMSAEDQAWLETVMREGVRDDPQRMDEVMQKVKQLLGGSSEVDLEVLQEDLEEVRDIVEQIDMAQVFTKFGGCDLLVGLAEERTKYPVELRALAVAIVGTVAQNNVTVQDILFNKQIVQRISRCLIASDETSELFKKKAFFAISCAVRGHAAAEEAFVLVELPELFNHLLSFRSEQDPSAYPLRAKLFFLASALIVSDYCSVERIRVLYDIIAPHAHLAPNSNTTDTDSAEQGAQLLLTLLHTHYGSRWLCGEHRVSLEATLAQWQTVLEENSSHILDIRTLLSCESIPIRYPLSSASSNGSTSQGSNVVVEEGGGVNSGTTVESNEDNNATVLMIEPPPLHASSRVP